MPPVSGAVFQAMEKIKVYVEDLRTGMYVSELDRPWLESPFLFQGFVLDDDDDLEKMRETCEYVFVDPEKGDIPPPEKRKPSKPVIKSSNIIEWKGRLSRKVQVSFHNEIGHARIAYDGARDQIDTMFNDVRMGQNISISDTKAVVSDMVDSIVRNPDAMQWLTNLRNRDEYTAIHSMNVCIFALTFGRHLGFDDDELNELGVGAILHDIGKMTVPLEILNKEGQLTTEELAIMKKHAESGYEILQLSADQLPETALLVEVRGMMGYEVRSGLNIP